MGVFVLRGRRFAPLTDEASVAPWVVVVRAYSGFLWRLRRPRNDKPVSRAKLSLFPHLGRAAGDEIWGYYFSGV
jgi:hypothetical protein